MIPVFPTVTVYIPATSANLGPGFDCFGLALGLYNAIHLAETRAGLEIEISGEGAENLPRDTSNMVYRSIARVEEVTGHLFAGLHLRLVNGIPLESGLGSSAAAVAGGLLAANALLPVPLDQRQLLRLAMELEGHPDNVAPAILGGLVVASQETQNPQAHGAGLIYARVEPTAFKVIVTLPDFRLPTTLARQALPQTVPLQDAVYNMSRAALVLLALQRGDYELLGRAMGDRLHQPYRARLIPGRDAVFAAAQQAGAVAVAVSGAGPSIIAFAKQGHEQIAFAMEAAFQAHGLAARSWILDIDLSGARIEHS
ncbi:MAG: homoserine kinase [Chloroflexi bacterium]|nr:homoserine kinase [Chloroflexota bacterium]